MNQNNKMGINRREFLNKAGLIAAGILYNPNVIMQQEENLITTLTKAAAKAKIKVIPLRGNISVLEGSGGNIAVLNSSRGKLMIDAGIGVSKTNILSALNSISNTPVKYLINTHWHFDHSDGNAWIQNLGATIIAQENTKKHLQSTIKVDDLNYTFNPAPSNALPSITFIEDYKLNFNGEKIEVQKYIPAHTDSDVSVYFPNADILHVADTFCNNYYPFIDYSTGGNIDGMIGAAKRNIDITTNKTIIIPGHGSIGNRSQLIEFHEMLVTVREKIARQKKEGKTLNEVLANKPTAQYDEKWGGFVVDGKTFTYLVYKGLT